MGANDRDAMETLVQLELDKFRAPVRTPLAFAATFIRGLVLASLVASAAWLLVNSVLHLSPQ